MPPCPFSIADLQLAGGGADLDVSIKEADGSITTYLVPYAAVPNMLQPGFQNMILPLGVAISKVPVIRPTLRN